MQLTGLESQFNSMELSDASLPILCEDAKMEIFSHLNLTALNRCLRVSKKWNGMAEDNEIWLYVIYRTFAFNKENWAKHYGEIKEAPLPKNIRAQLKNAHCALVEYYAEIKKLSHDNVRIAPVQNLFKLIAISPTLDNQPYEIEMFNKYLQNPKAGHKTSFIYPNNPLWKRHLQQSPETSYWLLTLKGAVEGSSTHDYMKLLKNLPSFGLPEALESIAGHATEYVETMEGLASPTYCKENNEFGDHLLVRDCGKNGFEGRLQYGEPDDFEYEHNPDDDEFEVVVVQRLQSQ